MFRTLSKNYTTLINHYKASDLPHEIVHKKIMPKVQLKMPFEGTAHYHGTLLFKNKTYFSKKYINQAVPTMEDKQLIRNKNRAKNYIKANTKEWVNSFPEYDLKLKEIAKQKFGIEELKDIQIAILKCLLQKNDVFVCIPTGGGKSLLFQMLTYLQPGVYVCILPIISLIHDQAREAEKYGIEAHVLSQDTLKTENKIFQALQAYSSESQKSMLILCTPEKLSLSKYLSSTLRQVYHRGHLKLITIDETHCVATWGKGLRPKYSRLGILKYYFPQTNTLAMTATAKQAHKRQIISSIRMKNAYLFESPFIRLNLNYQVINISKTLDESSKIIEEIATKFKNESGIVYCFSRQQCEKKTQQFCSLGYKASYYHAIMPPLQKKQTLMKWINNQVHIIFATMAFGMGINKPDVRYVIHASIPNSREDYLQQSGRAGRDGKYALCLLLYSQKDVDIKTKLILKNQSSKKSKQQSKQNLNQMVEYCKERKKCRHKDHLNFLQYEFNPSNCINHCDNCKKSQPQQKFIREACILARIIIELKDKSYLLNLDSFVKCRQEIKTIELHQQLEYINIIIKKWKQANFIYFYLQLEDSKLFTDSYQKYSISGSQISNENCTVKTIGNILKDSSSKRVLNLLYKKKQPKEEQLLKIMFEKYGKQMIV